MNQPLSDTAQSATAVIGSKTRMKGDLSADEDLLIEGNFTGAVILKAHRLTIGAAGHISGRALAKTVTVKGAVEGDLFATELLEVRKGAKIKGNLFAARISFEDGATLRGSVEMDPEAVQKAMREQFGNSAALGEDRTSSPIKESQPAAVSSPPSAMNPSLNAPKPAAAAAVAKAS